MGSREEPWRHPMELEVDLWWFDLGKIAQGQAPADVRLSQRAAGHDEGEAQK